MNTGCRWRWLVFAVSLGVSVTTLAQGKATQTFLVSGNSGEAKVLELKGHDYVDIRDLARITNGSLSFRENRLILTLPAPSNAIAVNGPAVDAPADAAAEQGLSRAFMRAAIEATASMREWRSTLAHLLRYGYPVGDEMVPYRERALDNLTLASAAATNSSDQSALQLLSNQFQNLSTWSNDLVKARNSASAAEYAISDDGLANDSLFQKISQCSRFLGPMLASGSFEDSAACH